jgi:hypothetical protein
MASNPDLATLYWVLFDTPQYDSFGNGPCEAAAIAGTHLSLIHDPKKI